MATSTVTQTLAPISQAATATADYTTGQISQDLAPISQAVTAFQTDAYATVAQTLAPVISVMQGDSNFFTLHETALASEHMLITDNQLLDDNVVLAGDSTSAIFDFIHTETVIASDEITYFFSADLHETALASGGPDSVVVNTLFAPKGAKASEQITFFFSDTLTSTITASEVLQPIISNELHETAYASSELTASGSLNQELTGRAVAYGAPEFFLGQSLEDTAIASDEIIHYNSVTAELVGTATATGTATDSVTTFEELISTVTADNQITFNGSVYNEELHETAVASEVLIAQDYGALAWVMNTETAGLTSYTNFGFHSITEHNGVLYATSNEGLYAINTDDDLGRLIESSYKTGFLDLGSQQTKRLSDVYVGYTGGSLELDVETYDGPQEVYTYNMEERDADAPRNNRIKIGKGLSSRYWRFSIKNVDGADFQVYDMSSIVGISKRRL